jgi:pimeloyl-ACP methyl ester carboxylesterase
MMIELKGRGFALLATVLSFIADNRDTQESIRWRLGSPANSDRILGRVAPGRSTRSVNGVLRARARLTTSEITHPTLVINGSNDVIIYPVNSFILQQNLPNAQLILYPDSNHGSQCQYPALFVAEVTRLCHIAK